MKHLLHKLSSLRLLMLLAVLLGMGSSAAWADTKTETFESATSATVYNSTATVSEAKSSCGIGWSIYYGNVSTTSKISGSNSCLMRYYSSSSSNLGYAKTTTGIQGLSNVTFNAKVTNTGHKMGVWYSTDGSNWTAIATGVTLTTSSQSKSYDIPNSSPTTTYYIKIGITAATTDKKDLIIDDIVFTYNTTIAITSISGMVSSASIEVGGTTTLIPTVLPANTTETVTWESDDEAVATVSAGVVTGVGAGSTTIRAKSPSDASIKAECTVTVTAATTVATPTISLAEGTYNAEQSATLSCLTDGATIRYTTDGTDPTSSSSVYSSAISVDRSMTLKAKAFKDGLTDSDIASATYTLKCATPEITVPSGVFVSSKVVTITTAAGTSLYYTDDGTNPTTSSTAYDPSNKPSINATKTIKAIATKDGWMNSDVASETFTKETVLDGISALNSATTSTTATARYVNLTNAQVTWTGSGNIGYLNDASAGIYIYGVSMTLNTKYNGVWRITTKKYNNMPEITAFAEVADEGTSEVASAMAPTEMTPSALDDAFSDNLGRQIQITAYEVPAGKTLTTNITLFGTSPYSDVEVGKTYTLIGYPFINSTTKTFRVVSAIEKPDAPTFSPASGDILKGNAVSISAGDGCAIYYTIGAAPSDPTSSSTIYSGAITIDEATTIKAIAVKSGLSSTVASASYTLLKPEAPTFSENEKTFKDAFDMTISSPEGTTIKYTTDGSDPANGTAVDSNSKTINISGATTTVRAISIKDGVSSLESSVTYTYDAREEPTFTLSTTSLILELDEEGLITLTTNSDGAITFESSDGTHLIVDNSSDETQGVVIGDQVGEYTITVSVEGSATYRPASCSVTVNITKKATTTAISDAGITNTDIYAGTSAGSMAASVTHNASAVGGTSVTWTSSDEDVATIAADGAVTLKKAGSTTLTATYEGDSEYKASSDTYELTVTDTTPMSPFELVTDVNQLEDGDVVTFVNETAGVAIGAKKTNNFGETSVSITDHAFEIKATNTAVTRFTMQAIPKTTNWYFKIDESNYLAAKSSSSNNMGTSTFGDENAKASISISSGDATITFQGSYTRKVVQYNSVSDLFSCYGSASQSAVQIYKKVKFNNTITTTTAYMMDLTKTPTPDTGVTFSAAATDGTVYYVLKSSTLDAEEYDLTGNVLSVESTAKSGVIVVTAKCDETSTHKAAEDVDITITVKGVAVDPTINVDDQNVEYSRTYTIDPSGFYSGPITSVTSSNTAVATVALVTGDYIVTGVAVGSATITINTAADGEGLYKAGSGSFTVNVTAPAGSTSAAEGESVTTTFINKDFGYDDPGLDWSSTDTATRSFESSGNARGVQIGAGVGEFTLSSTNSLPVASVSMIVSTNNASTNTLAVSVGGNAFTTDAGGSSATSYTMPSANNQSITFTGDGSGNIVIAVDDDTKTVWFKSITVTYIATDNVTLNANGYATYCSQYPMDLSKADGYTAWYPSAITADGMITFTKVTTGIKGGQGVLLRGDASDVVTVYSCNSSTTLDGNKFEGTTAPVYFSEVAQAYGLAGKTFVKNSAAGSIPAKKAYIPASNLPAEAKSFTFIFEDETTGITETCPATREEVEAIFNLGGQRLQKLQKGINIVNGRKVLVK